MFYDFLLSFFNHIAIKVDIDKIKNTLKVFLDFDGDNPAIIVNNVDWFDKINYIDFMRDIGVHFNVNKMLSNEIYKNNAEEDPVNCQISLSKTALFYEESESWEQLAKLYLFVAEKENDSNTRAFFFYKAGEIFYRRLEDTKKATECFEKSIKLNHSF